MSVKEDVLYCLSRAGSSKGLLEPEKYKHFNLAFWFLFFPFTFLYFAALLMFVRWMDSGLPLVIGFLIVVIASLQVILVTIIKHRLMLQFARYAGRSAILPFLHTICWFLAYICWGLSIYSVRVIETKQGTTFLYSSYGSNLWAFYGLAFLLIALIAQGLCRNKRKADTSQPAVQSLSLPSSYELMQDMNKR